MTQKQALKNLLNYLPYDFRLLWLSNWLEDINWHSECNLLWERNQYHDKAKMEALELIKYANDPAGYSYGFVQNNLKSLDPIILSELIKIKDTGNGMISGVFITSQDLIDLRKAETQYNTFNYIWGWGITNADWTDTAGDKFILELEEILKSEQE